MNKTLYTKTLSPFVKKRQIYTKIPLKNQK